MATKKELRNKLSQMEDLYYETIRDKIEIVKERLEGQQQIIDLKKKIEKLEKENKELKER